MKKIKLAQSNWSRACFGDIFQQLVILEDIVRIKEKLFEEFPICSNRVVLQKAQTDMKQYMQYEEECQRQKVRIEWFFEGDRNTRFFHNFVNGRRKRLAINRIQTVGGEWVEGNCFIPFRILF